MIYGMHIEVVLAAAYALVLVGVAAVLEYLARHSHRRSEHYRNSGFTYKRKLARYRAPAHKCNVCHCKKDCTDSHDGRELESRLDAWAKSELRRFHRGISLSLFLLAAILLAAEMVRHYDWRDWLLLGILLAPIGFAGSKLSVAFWERERKN